MESQTLSCARNVSAATLSAWRDGDLPVAEMQSLATHTAECPACQARLSGFDEVAHALLSQRELDPAGRIVAGVRARATHRRRIRLSRAQFWGGLGALSSVAALILLFVYVFGPALGNATPHLSYTVYHLPDSSYTIKDFEPGPGGAFWFSEIQIVSNPNGSSGFTEGHAKIARITAAGQITEYPLPATDDLGFLPTAGALTVAPDGTVWFTKLAGGLVQTAPPQTQIVKLTPDGVMTSYPLPGLTSILAFGEPTVTTPLTVGSDGNLWFGLDVVTHVGHTPADTVIASELARITPTGVVTAYPLPTALSHSDSLGTIVAGHDGNLWFTAQIFNADGSASTQLIARATTSGAVTTFPLPDPNSGASYLVNGPDGNLWFLESGDTGSAALSADNHVVRITPDGHMTSFPIPTQSASTLIELTASPAGSLYFLEIFSGCSAPCQQVESAVVRVTTSGQFSTYRLTNHPNALLTSPAIAADGNLYLTELAVGGKAGPAGTDRIARLTPSGHLSEYSVPTHTGDTLTLVPGAGRTLWLIVSHETSAPGSSTIVHISLPAQ